ncbi:hypothetical protein EYF80_026999 [Liparis tanakae]|uniref:Uncharacterized protein n=1 Tax=Liparis tanakae TaxID=230148 RepID=A0A4Z2HCM7_9TELE|nr:hypothetical protein EYF80_026999 [Liparis tanakae]
MAFRTMRTMDRMTMRRTTRQKHSAKKSALEKLFEDEDRELLWAKTTKGRSLSITEQVQKEIDMFKVLTSIPSGQDPAAWWWMKRDSLPILHVSLCTGFINTIREGFLLCRTQN